MVDEMTVGGVTHADCGAMLTGAGRGVAIVDDDSD